MVSDRSGTPKKSGFFGRLFGGKPEPEPDFAPVVPELEGTVVLEPEAPEDADPAGSVAAPPDLAGAPEPEPEPAPEPEPEPAPPQSAEQKRASWLARLRQGLTKTSSQLMGGITGVFTKRKLNAQTLEELEDLLIQADIGVGTAGRITARLKKEKFDKEITPDEVRDVLAAEIAAVLEPVALPLLIDPTVTPTVILMIGVNGTGKTTTIGKLAARFRNEGRTVMIAAGDTFRAAAIEQLQVWGDRTGAEVMARPAGSDAAGLAFDAFTEARKKRVDVLMIDTAGRLQNRTELMAELEKIVRVLRKIDPAAPHNVLLTLDATTGQNARSQVSLFRETAGVTGLVMTKLDGTARGGILVALAAEFGLPVHVIGVGEQLDDLQPFAAHDFARAIAGG